MKRKSVLLLSVIMAGSMMSPVMVMAESPDAEVGENVTAEATQKQVEPDLTDVQQYNAEDIVKNDETGIPDKALYDILLQQAGGDDGVLTKEELQSVQYLSGLSNAGISNISGIELCENLTDLSLDHNNISDISPIKNMKNLVSIDLTANSVGDISALEGLVNLRYLSLGRNQISDVGPVAGLVNLEQLILSDNEISRLPDLTALTKLSSGGIMCNFAGNRITLDDAKENLPAQLMDNAEWVSWQGFLDGNEGEESGELTFIPVSSIKLGESLTGKFLYRNASAGMYPEINLSKKDGNNFYLGGGGGGPTEFPSSGPVLLFREEGDGFYCGEAITPGLIQARCYANYNGEESQPVAVYPVTIEEPVITTNVPEVCYIGDEIEFNTTLTNTVLPEGNIEELKADGGGQHSFTYEAKTEILEGEELVVKESSDYSNAMNSSEKLTFKGEGTVKIRITYTPVNLWETPGTGEWVDGSGRDMTEAIYKPGKTITLRVTTPGKALEEEISIGSKLNKADYTEDSWEIFARAFEKARAVFNDPASTDEDYKAAYEELKAAREGLQLKENTGENGGQSTPPTTVPSGTGNTTSGAVETDAAKTAVPRTGDNSNAAGAIGGILGASAIGVLAVRKRRQ